MSSPPYPRIVSILSADRRRELPDEPGVYLFRDARGRVLYVGKAKSIKKRVASHFSNPSTRGGKGLTEQIDHVEALVVYTDAEALLAEQNFIKQYKPQFNIRLRDDKSYPYIAISLDEDFPRVYFTRERHRRASASPTRQWGRWTRLRSRSAMRARRTPRCSRCATESSPTGRASISTTRPGAGSRRSPRRSSSSTTRAR